MGAGRLQIATAAKVATAVAVAMPEARVTSIDVAEDGPLATLLAAADAVVIGPGLDDIEQTCRLLAMTLERTRDDAVIVVDALGLDALPLNIERVTARPRRLVVTPNREELEKLSDGQGDERQVARSVARRLGLTVVSFGHVAGPEGQSWIDTGTVTGLGTSGAGRCARRRRGRRRSSLSRRIAGRLLGNTLSPLGRHSVVRGNRSDRLPRTASRRRDPSRTRRTHRAIDQSRLGFGDRGTPQERTR